VSAVHLAQGLPLLGKAVSEVEKSKKEEEEVSSRRFGSFLRTWRQETVHGTLVVRTSVTSTTSWETSRTGHPSLRVSGPS